MSTDSRKLVRKELAGILTGALVGDGLPVQAVYDNRVGDFGGQSPVVVVSSGGGDRKRITYQGTKSEFVLTIHVFVIYADSVAGWTEGDAEDTLDDINQIISNAVLDDNKKSQYWDTIGFIGPSNTGSVEIGGKEYRTEVYEVTVK